MNDVTPKLTTVAVNMTYDGNALSKNHLWVGGVRRVMNPVAKEWKATLAQSVRYALLAEGIARPSLPLTIEVRSFFESRGKACDPQNLVELIADAVEEGTGLNDLDYQITTYPPQFRVVPARIEITVTVAKAVPPKRARAGSTVAVVQPALGAGGVGRKKGVIPASAAGTRPSRKRLPCTVSPPQVATPDPPPARGSGRSRKRSSAT